MSDGCVVIRVPDPLALRVIARSVLVAVMLFSLAWVRSAEVPARRRAADACGAALQAELLLDDLRREGLLAPGARAVLISANPECYSPVLEQDGAMRVRAGQMLMLEDSSVDLLLDSGHFYDAEDPFSFPDRVLKDGGVVLAPIGSGSMFRVPQNYRIVYIRQFTKIFVGIKKIHVGDDGTVGARVELGRPATIKEGLLTGQPAETADGDFKNMGRKFLLSGTPTAQGHQPWFKMRRPRTRVDEEAAACSGSERVK